jgi:hypothetical protein
MESVVEPGLFRRVWRSFLPLWLLPVPITGAILLADFSSEDTAAYLLPFLVTVIVIYLVVALVLPLGLFRRREITYWEMQLFSSPIALVALACILLRLSVLAYFRQSATELG